MAVELQFIWHPNLPWVNTCDAWNLDSWFSVHSHFLHLLQFPADYHVISILGSVTQLTAESLTNTAKYSLWDVQKHKGFQLLEGFAPGPLSRGSAPGPRWGLNPQTSLIGSRSALTMVRAPPLFLSKFTSSIWAGAPTDFQKLDALEGFDGNQSIA